MTAAAVRSRTQQQPPTPHRAPGLSPTSPLPPSPVQQPCCPRRAGAHEGHVPGWASASPPCAGWEPAVPPHRATGTLQGERGPEPHGARAKPTGEFRAVLQGRPCPRLDLALTPLTLTASGSAGDFTAPKIEMSSQLPSSVQEKYSIPCLESFLLLIIIENAACFETNSILCRLECRLFLLVYYASSILVYRKAAYLKMYSFKYCVYYTSKASVEHHGVRLPGREVRELSSPPAVTQDPGSSPAACPSPIAGSAGAEAAAASENETAGRWGPRPPGPSAPGCQEGLLALGWTSPRHFGPWPPRAKVCLYAKVQTKPSLGIALYSIGHGIEFSCSRRAQ